MYALAAKVFIHNRANLCEEISNRIEDMGSVK